jgi:hypothetical protein
MIEAVVYVRKLAIFAETVRRKDKLDTGVLLVEVETEESAPKPQQYKIWV